METQEALDSLDKALIIEGVSDEERIQRVDILKECIEKAEEMSAKMKAMKPKKGPARQMNLGKAIELSLMALIIGWMAGVLSLHYYQTAQ